MVANPKVPSTLLQAGFLVNALSGSSYTIKTGSGGQQMTQRRVCPLHTRSGSLEHFADPISDKTCCLLYWSFRVCSCTRRSCLNCIFYLLIYFGKKNNKKTTDAMEEWQMYLTILNSNSAAEGGGGGVAGNWNRVDCQRSDKKIQNTREIKRTIFNWTKQDKTCKFSRKSSFSSYVQHKNRKKQKLFFPSACPRASNWH